MWPNYYVIESMRVASEREAAERRYRREAAGAEPGATRPNLLRRGFARLALSVSRQSFRLAQVLDECASDPAGARPAHVG